jgi:hypothetical protein
MAQIKTRYDIVFCFRKPERKHLTHADQFWGN